MDRYIDNALNNTLKIKIILENKRVYLSKSSTFVKLVTIGTLVLLVLASLTLMTINSSYGVIGGTILNVLIIGTVIYFYATALEKIMLEKDNLILKKKVGKITISKIDIISVNKLEYSNLTMTCGSKGFFGFIGSTMDDSVSLVKDRKNMLRIVTKDKKYIVSAEKRGELINEIKVLLQD